MKIKNISFRLENLDLVKPYTIAWKTVSFVENLFCILELENGILGYGSCNPENEVVRVSTQDTINAKDHFDLDRLIGQSIEDPAALIDKISQDYISVPTFLAMIDMAIWDAWAKSLNKPLAEAWGIKINPLPTSVTIGIMNTEQTITEADIFKAQGFTHLKVKIGLDPDQDIERLSKLREYLGTNMVIRTDVNQGYTLDGFKKLWTACQSIGVELYEQPIRADHFDTVDALPLEMRRSIAADESLHSNLEAINLATHKRCGIFNIKLMKCGGLHEAHKIASTAADADIDLMWGCNDESRLSIAAALHAAYSCPNTKYLDLDGSFDLSKDPAMGGFRIDQGNMYLLDKPGLGLDLNF